MSNSIINREEALWNWVSRPPQHGGSILFDFLRGVEGSCSIAPVSDEVVKSYIDGSQIRHYTFAMQIILAVSDADDNTNIDNMKLVRTWQEYIVQQGRSRDFPDFGPNCSDYRLLNANASPKLAELSDNNQARYDFYATIIYKEEQN